MSISATPAVAASTSVRAPSTARPAASGTTGTATSTPAATQNVAAQKPAAAAAQVNVALAALQEFSETAAQTAKEAQSGDRQAVKLLAKEAAALNPVVNSSGQVTGTIINTKA